MGNPSTMLALFSILGSFPTGMPCRASAEVADDGERQTVQSSTESHCTCSSAAPSVVWVATKSGIMQTLRLHSFETLHLDRREVSAAGFWKRSDLDYRDPDTEWR